MDDSLLTEIERKSPRQTLEDIKPYLDEAGVTRVADITGMDRIGIPAYCAIRPDSKSLAVDSGKGITKIQAKCSACMEAIERWAQDYYPRRDFVGPAAQHSAYRFPMVRGATFNWHLEHKWIEADYITEGRKVLVPYYQVFNYERRLPLYEMCWQSGTNGLAAGNTKVEATLQGLYEIIERDAVSIWMTRGANRHGTNRIKTEHLIDKDCRDLAAMCENAGVEVCLYNATTDIGVPVYICLLVDKMDLVGIYKGYGCNLDHDVAIQRAICEAAQGRAVFLSGGRDDMRWLKHTTDSHHSTKQALVELMSEPTVQIPHKNYTGLDLSDAEKIVFLEDKITGAGCGKVAVVTIMEREHASVVKVMSEKLEGYWNHYLELGRRARGA